MEDFFLSTLTQQNRVASASDHLLPIHEMEVVILCLQSAGKSHLAPRRSHPLHEVSSILRVESYILTTPELCQTMQDICASHHNLMKMTVTGIPMKEEQNALSSSNYDVELFAPWLENFGVDTTTPVILKWSSPCAPKGQGLGKGVVQQCHSACRISPVDVIGRPSTCLSNFVVGGRSVWLEVPKTKSKTTSHVLTSHGGEMWLHIMDNTRNVLEDPPSISEGVGGRVTDYRIPDFIEFMKLNMLIPYHNDSRKDSNPLIISRRSKSTEEDESLIPIKVAKQRLCKKTSYWPLTLSGSLLFPMSVHLDALLRLMPNDDLSDAEKNECESSIWSLMSIEARGEAPPIPSQFHKKGAKKEDLWKLVYGEIETYLKANLFSDNHRKVFKCFQESRASSSGRKSMTEDKIAKILDPSVNQAMNEIACLIDGNGKSTLDSPMSPTPTGDTPPPTRRASVIRRKSSASSGGGVNLLTLWTARTEKKDFRIIDPATKLYSHGSSASKDNGTKA